MIQLNPCSPSRCRSSRTGSTCRTRTARSSCCPPSPVPCRDGTRPGDRRRAARRHTRQVWDAVALAAGKREGSLVLAISTPGAAREGVMWDLVEHGRRGDDPSFAFVEYAAPEGCARRRRGGMADRQPCARRLPLPRRATGDARTTASPSGEGSGSASGHSRRTPGCHARRGMRAATRSASPTAPRSCSASTVRTTATPPRSSPSAWATSRTSTSCACGRCPPGDQVPIIDVEDEIREACQRWR